MPDDGIRVGNGPVENVGMTRTFPPVCYHADMNPDMNPLPSSPAVSAAPPSFTPMIRVEGVTYDYPGHRALDNVSFALPPASVTALIGPNGAGKTTLLRIMAALDAPMYGQVFIDGLDVREAPREAHRLMGYLPDHFGLYQDLRARQCLLYAAHARGLGREAAESAALWAAKEVDLLPRLDARASTLSRGQRQRLALAQAIVHRPQVLLLDEPASGLDPQARLELSRLMKSLAVGGMTLVVSSHILAELESYSSAMLALENGRLIAHQLLASAAGAGKEKTEAALDDSPRLLRIQLEKSTDDTLAALRESLEKRGLRVMKSEKAAHALLVEGRFDAASQGVLLCALVGEGWPLVEFARETRNLQETYLEMLARQKNGREKE